MVAQSQRIPPPHIYIYKHSYEFRECWENRIYNERQFVINKIENDARHDKDENKVGLKSW